MVALLEVPAELQVPRLAGWPECRVRRVLKEAACMGWALWRKGKLGRPPLLTLSQPGWARAAPEPAEAGQQLYWALQHQLGYHPSALQHGLHGFCCLGIRRACSEPLLFDPWCAAGRLRSGPGVKPESFEL